MYVYIYIYIYIYCTYTQGVWRHTHLDSLGLSGSRHRSKIVERMRSMGATNLRLRVDVSSHRETVRMTITPAALTRFCLYAVLEPACTCT
jgi:hypothetical protein